MVIKNNETRTDVKKNEERDNCKVEKDCNIKKKDDGKSIKP